MKKGSQVIYQNELYIVWHKEKNFVWIYKPEAALPELTMICTGVKSVKKVK